MKPPSYYDNARLDVIDILPKLRFPLILEVGGGNFPTLLKLRDDHDAQVWGVDVRRPEIALDTFVQGCVTNRDVAERLPQNFDLVIANDVIEHVERTESFFLALHALLRPGGVLALSVPNIRQLRTAYQIFLRGTFPRDDAGLFDRTHLRWFCKKDVADAAASAGFTLQNWRGSGRLVPPAFAKLAIAEFLALQNLFIFTK